MTLAKAWINFNRKSKKWSLAIPDGGLTPFDQYYLGCTEQYIPLQINLNPTAKRKKGNLILLQTIGHKMHRIGPLIGILSVAKEKRLLGNHANFIDIIKAGGQLGALIFVFTPNDLDWDVMQVNGRFYDFETKKWFFHTIPFPDVVYNRVPNRGYENDPVVSDAIQRLQLIPNLRLFNPHFFDKWELYQILHNTDVHPHLPDTARITDAQTLTHLLKKYNSLYLKPTTGKAGSGIYRLQQNRDRFLVQYSFNGEKMKFWINSIGRLWSFLKPIVEKTPYVAQEAVSLLTYKNNPFDVRILIQKNGKGKWEVSGIGFRVAGNGGITTHVPQGGEIITRSSALDPYFSPQGSEQLLTNIKDIALKIATRLDEFYKTLGEMSMDLGVTKEGSIWFFEANAKPMKFDEPEIRSTSLRQIIEYSKYLSRFVQH